MAKKRYSHKKIKQDIKKDELRSLIDKFINFSKGHTENLLITGIIIVVIIVLIPLYFKHQADNEVQAAGLYNQALGMSMQPVGQDRPGQFKTVEEKYKQLGQQYSDIVASYKNTSAGKLARIGEGNAAFYAKDYEKAVTIFQGLLNNDKPLPLQGTIKEKLANSIMQQEKWQEALTQFDSLLTNHPNYFNQSAVKINMAKCYQALSKINEAKTLLEEQAKTDSQYWSTIAKRQLAQLEK